MRYFHDDPGAQETPAEPSTAVEEAQGLLVERLGCTTQEALGRLRRVADDLDVHVIAVATTLLGEVTLDTISVKESQEGRPLVEARCYQHYSTMGETGEKPHTGLETFLDAITAPAAVLIPIYDPEGLLVEFRFDRCNSEATDLLGRVPEHMIGRRLRETFPGIMLTGIFETYAAVLETGVAASRGPLTYWQPINGVLYPVLLSVRAHKLCCERLLVSWQFHNEEARLATKLDDAHRLARLGWAEWNLVTGETSWTKQIYEIFGREPEEGPIPFPQLAEHVAVEDAPTVTHAIEALTRREPVTFEFRVGERWVGVTAEPILDGLGQLLALRAVMQDVSARRCLEEALAESRRELEDHQRHYCHDAEELQRALLPETQPILPSLRVAVHYHPAENRHQVGGDWFEATTLPDGRVLIVIGDASGHGLSAAARMAQLRNALLGAAYAGCDAVSILTCLNLIVYHTQDQTATATAIVAHFDPVTLTLVWARAGHPPPILVRDGHAKQLDNSGGPLLGATNDPPYRPTTTPLQVGDLVLLYTDGLVERRPGHGTDPFDVLLKTVGGSGTTDPDEVLSRIDIGNPEDDTCVLAILVTG